MSTKRQLQGLASDHPMALALAAVAAVPALWVGYRAVRKMIRAPRSAAAPDPAQCESWSNAQVLVFLEAHHLSPQCISAFRDNDIDGSVLFQLEASHLGDMGVKKLKDRILFQKCVDAIRPSHLERERSDSTVSNVSSDEDAPKPLKKGTVDPRLTSEERDAITPAVHRLAGSEDRAKVIHAVVLKLQNIYNQCSTDDFLEADPSIQLRVIRSAKAELANILHIVQSFPQEEVASVMPLTQQLSAMLDGVEQELSKPPAQQPRQNAPQAPAAAAASINPDASEALAKLHAMLDGFLQAMGTLEASKLPPADRERLAMNISTHVMRSLEVASALPPQEQAKMKQKCDTVLRAAKELLHGNAPAAPAAASARQADRHVDPEQAPHQPASIQFLIRRVRAIFDTLKSDKLMALPPHERDVVIRKMRGEVNSIEAEAKHLPEQERQVMGQVFQNVKQVVEQLSSLTEQENEMSSLQKQQVNVDKERKGIATTLGRSDRPQGEAGNPVERISSSIKQVLEVLKNPEFLKSPTDVQLRNCAVLMQRLNEVASELAELPAPIQQAVSPMLTKVTELVRSVQQHGEHAIKAGQTTSAATRPPAPQTQAQLDDASLAQESSAEFADVIGRLKEVYDFISSEAFESATPSVRAEQAKELLAFVTNVAGLTSALPEKERKAVEELTSPLIKLLTHVKGDQAATPAAPARGKATGDQKKKPDAAAGPSAEFQTIVESLQQVFSVVNSDRFKSAPPSAQQSIAEKLSEHVEAMVPHFAELGEEEQRVVEKFSEPLRQLLAAVTRQGKPTAPSTRGAQPAVKAAAAESAEQAQADADNSDESMDLFAEVLTKLRSLMNVAQSDKFIRAPREKRLAVASMLLEELQSLNQATRKLTGEQRQKVQPAISQMVQLLSRELQPVEEIEEDAEGDGDDQEQDQEGEEGQVDEQQEPYSENDEQVGNERLANFRKGLEGIRLMRSRTLTFDELQDQLTLLDDIDSCGVASEEEIQIREVFHKELEAAIRKVKKQHGIVDDDDDGAEEGADEGSAQQDDGAAEEQQQAENPKAGVAQVLQAFDAICRALRQANITSTSQLIPITSMIEDTLQAADGSNIQWRSDPAAVKLVGDTLGLVQSIQERIQSAPAVVSDIEKVLRSALKQIASQPPETSQELTQYIEILDEIQELQEHLTREDLIAYQELQKAVLSRHKLLSTRPKAMQEAPLSASDSGSLRSPQYSTAVPPNTPAVRADATSDQPPALVRDEEEEGTNEEDEDGEGQEGNNENNESKGDIDELPEEEQIIARMVLQMVDKLQRQRFSNQELSAFDQIMKRLRTQTLHPEVQQVLSIAEELLDVHRQQNVADELKTARTAPSQERAKSNASSPAKAQSPKADAAATPVETPTEEVDEEEGIPDGYANELSLLPRILERLALPDFVQTTTLFEIKCISKILTQLSMSRDVRTNANLLEAIEKAKVLFSEHMQRYTGVAKDAASVVVPTVLTGMDVEDINGEQVRQFTIVGGEEAEEYTINEDFLAVALNAGTALEVEAVPPQVQSTWEGRSRAIIFCVQQYPNGEESATALSELMMLHDVLDRKHNFDIVSVVDDQLSLEEARQMIKDVVADQPTRLLLYFYSPMPPCVAPATHALTFFDNSVLTHGAVLTLCQTVERVTLIHDRCKALEVVASYRGTQSKTLSVALTEGAAQVANTSRCWLFDGLFTPLVVELLGRDDEGTVICPEELVSFAITALTTNPIAAGKSFTKDPALGMGFWVTSEGISA